MGNEGGNIFLTTENLAFSMPLILVCALYAYFKFVPTQYGLPALGAVIALLVLKSKIQASKAEKLQNMDEHAINRIANELEEEEDNADMDAKKSKKQGKSNQRLQQRLAAEKKANKESHDEKVEDDDDDDAIENFAKGSREKQKKR